MKRTCGIVLTFVTALQISSVCIGQESTPTAGTPAITLATNTFDFGRIKQGEVAKCIFYFTNSGTAMLEITSVKPGCGCTTMGTWDKLVEPGKSGSIPLQLNSANFGGKIHKSATVTCNVPGMTNILLHLQGEVWKPIEVTPQMVAFTFPAEDQTNQSRVVRIVNNTDEEITLSPPECVNPVFKPELKEIKPGRQWELQVTAIAPVAPPTQLATVLIRTSSKQVPAINVSAYASIPPVIATTPNYITVPAGPLKEAFKTTVNVRNNGSKSVSLSDVAIDAPGAEAKLAISQDGKYFTVDVSFPAEFNAKPTDSYALTMKTDHPQMPVIRIPVHQPQQKASVTPRPRTTPTAGKISAAASPVGVAPQAATTAAGAGAPPLPGSR